MLRPWEKRAMELRDRYCVIESPGKGWRLNESGPYGVAWGCPSLGLRVLQSVVEVDGDIWLHTSLSRPSKWRLPTYEDVVRVRRLFIGEDRETFQLFPVLEQHVNLANVLHLYTPLRADQFKFPDFRVELAPGVWDLK